MTAATTLVVPTLGRPSLTALLDALGGQTVAVDAPVVLVDDRPAPDRPLPRPAGLDVTVVSGGGRGPAHARNVGWRHARTPWVSFVDDDVLPDPGWYAALLDDLAAADREGLVGSEGRLRVPLPRDRRPTDWERGTAGLETSRWITADLSYLREAVAAVGGFDERFPRAFREDADLALRVQERTGGVIATGRRTLAHPVRPADDWASLRQQAGNADDALMRRVHGGDWHRRADAPRGRLPRHVAVTAAGALGLAGLVARRPGLAALGAAGWLAGTAEFARARIAPGPRDRAEVRRMLLTSAAIPPAAVVHRLRGEWRHRRATPWRGLLELVLLDRDGTLVVDVPYNGDPAQVRPLPGVRDALDRLRAEGVRLAVVSNQSGIGRGLLTTDQVEAVNARVEELLGPFKSWHVCPHGPDDGCDCRKPQPGLVKAALAAAGVTAERAVLVGDIGADVEAARAAGVAAYLVPTAVTRREEVDDARRTGVRVVDSLTEVVAEILRGAR